MALQETQLTFYYDTMLDDGDTLLATSTSATSASFSIDNIHNFLETNSWLASSSATQHIMYKGSTLKDADYLVIYNHNLGSAGASITLQASSATAFAGEQSTAIASTAITADTIYINEFATVAPKNNWRLSISGQTTATFMRIGVWGTKTPIAMIQPPFAPHGQQDKSNVSQTQGGAVSGVHKKFTERELNIALNNSSTTLYETVRTMYETIGQRPFFAAWNGTDEIYHVRTDGNFRNSFNVDQLADIQINLRGKKEG